MKTAHYSDGSPLYLILTFAMGDILARTVAVVGGLFFVVNQLWITKRRVDMHHSGSWKNFVRYFYTQNLKPKPKKNGTLARKPSDGEDKHLQHRDRAADN